MTATHKKPPIERELKFAGVDLDQLRSRLLELECERLGPPSNEDNWLLDRKGELHAAGGVLRVRQDGRGALITFKGPPAFEAREIRLADTNPVPRRAFGTPAHYAA